MPIRPEMKDRYPTNWKEIRERIRARAGNKCEWCQVENHTFRNNTTGETSNSAGIVEGWSMDGDQVARIICTVAHIDHQPENCSNRNLRFLCQRCHNRHDHANRISSRRARLEKDQLPLF